MNIGGFVDIHCHILPGVDDGARDIEKAKLMLRQAAEDGITDIVATPHNKSGRHNADKQTCQELISELDGWLKENKIPINLYLGNEILYRHGIDDLLEAQEACTLADSFYVLTEFSPKDDYGYIRSGVQEIVLAGYSPVIAHVERYDAIACNKGADRLEELIELGAYIQVNAASIEGKAGFFEKRRVLKWIKSGLVDIVATDGHGTNSRPVKISESAKIVKSKCGRDIAEMIYHTNPQSILQNKLIYR